MKRTLLSSSILLACAFAAAQPVFAQTSTEAKPGTASIGVPNPAVHVREAVERLRANDLLGLAQVMMPPAQFQMLQGAYEIGRQEQPSDRQREKFAEFAAHYADANAVDKLMEEIEPKLVEARPKAEGAVLMGLGAMQMAISSPDADLSDEQRAALRLAMPGIERWVKSTDFLSSDSMRQALTLVTNAARATGIFSIEDLQQLSLEQALSQGSSVLAATKQALRIYGLDLDAIADSVYVEVLDVDGKSATVRTTVTIFEAPISKEMELVLVDGRWYGKEAVVNFDFDDDDHFHFDHG
ncbi:MAG: hypothetical protein KDI71_05475 [Xanthomonadales bacterium]|nr:hypothetical protein [Xanthomonadales bacterium]